MKVFFVGTRGFPNIQGGIERHCESICPILARNNTDITVLTRKPYVKQSKAPKEYNGVKFIHVWAPRNKYFEATIHTLLGVIIARIKSPDILHFHAIGPSLFIPLARLLGLRVVMTHHGQDYHRDKWGTWARFVLRTGEILGIRFANHVIAISLMIEDFLMRKYHIKRIIYIPNGVNVTDKNKEQTQLKKYHVEPGRYILAVCRFVPEKGLHDLIAAFTGLKKPGFKLVIVGQADHETEYSRMIRQRAGQVNGIILTGYLNQKQLSEFYSHAGLFVLPSYHEGLPIVLLEALSYDLPVLVSNIPANRELNLPEYRYYPVGNTEVLAKKIMELYNRGLSQKELQINRGKIRHDFSWETAAQRTRKLYRQVCTEDK